MGAALRGRCQILQRGRTRVTLTLEQSKVAALGYDATEKDLLAEKKNAYKDTLKAIRVLAFIDIIKRRRVRISLGRRSFESRSKVEVVRYRGSV